MVSKPPCPAEADLKRLLDGNLPDTEQTVVSRHVDICPACQQQLQDLSAEEDAWDAVAGHLKSETTERREPLKQAMNQLRGLRLLQPTQHGVDEDEEDPLTFLDPPVKPRQLGRLNQYEIIEIIGRGGMGIVFKALDPDLHRIVAIKVMAPQLAVVPSARGRFLREARATAKICHEHVITIHAVEPKKLPYFVMQFISGVSLQDRLEKRGALRLEDIVRIGMQMAQGLAAAHAQGLVHRDIKPANILLENGAERVKITDFGLARAASDARLTQSGVIVGTPQYMAPEQASGDAVDHRADLFSLGSVLYFMCTGRSPFQGVSTMAVIRRVCDEMAAPIQEINPNIPKWLSDIIARLQDKNPAQRFQSAAEVAELLNKHLKYLQSEQSAPAASTGIKTICLPAEALSSTTPIWGTNKSSKGRGRKQLALIASLCLLACFGAAPVLFHLAFPPSTSISNPVQETLTGQPQDEDPDEAPPAPLPNIPPPRLDAEQVRVDVGGKFEQVRTGGGGRYLVFHLTEANQLAIFDVSTRQVRTIDLETGGIYACGREKLMIVYPSKKRIERIDLTTLQSEGSEDIPGQLRVRQAAMGCNSTGPLLLWTGENKPVFFDIDRMRQRQIEGGIFDLVGDLATVEQIGLHASADGQTFIAWNPKIHPTYYSVIRVVGRKAVVMRSPDGRHDFADHWAMPSADASLFLCHGGGLYSAKMESLVRSDSRNAVLLPTEDPRFFLALGPRKSNKKQDEVTICATVDHQPLLTIPILEKMTADIRYTHWGIIGGEPRIHYLPSAKVLLTLPEDNRHVVMRPLDVFATIKQENKDYLFVLSLPKTHVRAKELYEDAIDIHSKAGGVRYQLRKHPEGMTLSPQGRLVWQVPSDQCGKTVRVIVLITDASDKRLQHSFDITVK